MTGRTSSPPLPRSWGGFWWITHGRGLPPALQPFGTLPRWIDAGPDARRLQHRQVGLMAYEPEARPRLLPDALNQGSHLPNREVLHRASLLPQMPHAGNG